MKWQPNHSPTVQPQQVLEKAALVYDGNILIAALAPQWIKNILLTPVDNPSLVAARSWCDRLHL